MSVLAELEDRICQDWDRSLGLVESVNGTKHGRGPCRIVLGTGDVVVVENVSTQAACWLAKQNNLIALGIGVDGLAFCCDGVPVGWVRGTEARLERRK